MDKFPKTLLWIGSSKKDLQNFPEEVQSDVGFGLYQSQLGKHPTSGKTLSGFGGANVIELIAEHRSGTFRAVYTVRFAKAVIVLHVFQKKSTKGIATTKQDIELIKSRLKLAEEVYADYIGLTNRKNSNERIK